MNVQSGAAELSGARLHYEVAGSGQPLVLVHGLGLDLRMWDDQFTPLAHRFHVLRYDVRGYGQSTLPTTEPYSHADDLKGLLGYLGIAHTALAGLSFGGRLAINFTLTYPELVQRLILVDSGLNGYQYSPEWNGLWTQILTEAATRGPKAANELWLRHPLFAPAREQAAVAARLTQMIADYSGWHWVHTDPVRWTEPPDNQRLDQIHVPTLIVSGQRDLPDFHAIAALLQQRIPQASTALLAQVGHMANMEAPTQFNHLVESFLSAD